MIYWLQTRLLRAGVERAMRSHAARGTNLGEYRQRATWRTASTDRAPRWWL